jgi:hypothetical protein
MQFTHGESVDSRQSLLLLAKSHASHSQSDQRSGVGEEEVRLLSEHHAPLIAYRYVVAVMCSNESSIRKRKTHHFFIL